MSESPEQTPYLSIDLLDQGGPIHWQTEHEVIVWLNTVQNQWDWLQSLGLPAGDRARSVLHQCLNVFRDLINQAIQSRDPNPQHAANVKEQAARQMQSWFHTYPWLLGKSAKAEFIEKLKADNKSRIAAHIVAIWLGQDISGTSPQQDGVEAVIELYFFEHGYQDRSKQERLALKKLAEEYGTKISESHIFEKEMTERFRALDEQAVADTAAKQSVFDTAQEEQSSAWQGSMMEQKSDWDKELADAKARLETLESTYKAHMKLKAPVLYWKAKAERHFKWAVGSGIAVVLSMAIVGRLLYLQIQEVGQTVKSNAALAEAAAKAAKTAATSPMPVDALSSTWHFDVAILVLLGTLSFWFIRLLVRVFLSHLHLENDAAERVTMAETYLALSNENKLPEGEDLRTVLAALFRPSGDGIVKDEGLPPSMVDFLTRLNK